jgi:DNA-directed RNA polymerase subunit M/transcription elongation factor TFIIS
MNEQPQQYSRTDGPAIMPNCPYCGVPLHHERAEGDTQYYECERCGGLVMPRKGAIRHLETLRNKRDPQFVFDAVTAWQNDPDVYPLTCCEDSRHRLLYPILQADGVVLHCRDCDYRQTYIPDAVVKAYGDKRRRQSRKA